MEFWAFYLLLELIIIELTYCRVIWLQIDVNGESSAPIYKFLKSSKGGIFGDSIKWNFSKFLVDKEGHVVDRYAPTTSPLSIEVRPFCAILFHVFRHY